MNTSTLPFPVMVLIQKAAFVHSFLYFPPVRLAPLSGAPGPLAPSLPSFPAAAAAASAEEAALYGPHMRFNRRRQRAGERGAAG